MHSPGSDAAAPRHTKAAAPAPANEADALPEGLRARCAGPTWLAQALQASRRDTLATFAAVERVLPALQVPHRPELNPPLWELGHIGWFQEYWLARFTQRLAGQRADPDAPRHAPRRKGADALYHSSRVPHVTRWSLPLPDATTTRADLAAQLQGTLELLQQSAADDDALYFFRLALLHEDMHHEAALYMAQGLGIPVADARWQCPALPAPPSPLAFKAGRWRLGSDAGAGFAFDNELKSHEVEVGACSIDAQVLRWGEFLPFVESGGYAQARWWDAEGRRWLAETRPQAPRYLRRGGGHAAPPARGRWQQWRHGHWRVLDLNLPACHLTRHEALAWCRWAGRRLPGEAEWERAAVGRPEAFRWGDVWEWTAGDFAPYPGFGAHPYRDYSEPWFGTRAVLRGASFMTQPRMRHPRYRNFFQPHRNDLAAGFRTCAG
jgi:ergothioneine biosynthesis protein EgtB